MRNMSFSLTTPQFKAKTKTVTRRLGWSTLKRGEHICAVEKAMGLKKGEKIKRLGVIYITSVRSEPLNSITDEDCVREGFPELTPEQFVEMFSAHNNCSKDQIINRIEFEYI
jgi:hypothetical protein